jgi:hypothetical protein
VAAAALAGFAVIFGVTGPNLAHAYAASGLASCRGNCTSLSSTFLSQVKSDSVYPLLYFAGGAALYLTPALIGIFWGAPLVSRELEAGTLRLTWNQSVTRTRWMAAKLGLIGLVAMATAGLLSLMVTWWSGPIDQAGGFPVTAGQLSRFSPLVFDARGFVPIGYVAFAFTLGATVGVLTRRTLPAMAIVLACVAVVQLGWPSVVRPHLIPPATSTSTVSVNVSTARVGHEGELAVPVTGMPGAWIVSNQTITPGREGLRAARRRGLQHRHPAAVQPVPRHPAPAAADHLPARQPLLGLPSLRDSNLRRPFARPRRVQRLVDPLKAPGLIGMPHIVRLPDPANPIEEQNWETGAPHGSDEIPAPEAPIRRSRSAEADWFGSRCVP